MLLLKTWLGKSSLSSTVSGPAWSRRLDVWLWLRCEIAVEGGKGTRHSLVAPPPKSQLLSGLKPLTGQMIIPFLFMTNERLPWVLLDPY